MSAEPLVLDATLALAWCFADEATTYSRGILAALEKRPALVPATWFFDLTRMLAAAQHHQRISGNGVADFLQRLRGLPIEIDYAHEDLALIAQVPPAEQIALTPYNLPYVQLARRRKLSLATLDDSLRAAARVSGVRLVEVVVG